MTKVTSIRVSTFAQVIAALRAELAAAEAKANGDRLPRSHLLLAAATLGAGIGFAARALLAKAK